MIGGFSEPAIMVTASVELADPGLGLATATGYRPALNGSGNVAVNRVAET
jgi:hypothetical protein